MTAVTLDRPHLIDRLPPVRGRIVPDVALGAMTWFRTGGPAEVLYSPADAADLADFLRSKPADVPVTVIGVGSNLLVRDGGVPGVVIRLGRGFGSIAAEGAHIRAGAAVPDARLAEAAAEAGIAGLSFFRGIPGTIGGAVAMNAGCYGVETKDVLVEVEAVTVDGQMAVYAAHDLPMTYRSGGLPSGAIVTAATFEGRPGDADAIRTEMAEITAQREASQPVRTRTGGSTFRNPEGGKAWELIDRAGCRGLRVGGAQVSEKHCNFLINTGEATSADLETLGETVRARVLEATGVDLHWEIRRIGVPAAGGEGA
ncbi:MAG: UDP-N-acetylmuramate dehydrogenase [Alphaproteobacteria bacterium]|nr:UDP-N-acetylmuramate dehydrogenase [Alphaproteobacteria bacterium]MDX5368792.1 UDP-N-acetylmuramate dehydrogenase [Alphaproteobacteria bacterium]MDX5463526.1 UDP-N-acetylmuramate dehydrogenase [Alphaproteobacteria bacterium]